MFVFDHAALSLRTGTDNIKVTRPKANALTEMKQGRLTQLDVPFSSHLP